MEFLDDRYPKMLKALECNSLQLASASARMIAERSGIERHPICLHLGTGWGRVADLLGPARVKIPWTELPGFIPPSVDGHAGMVSSITVSGVDVLVYEGRLHTNEFRPGRGVEAVVFPTLVALEAGAEVVIHTNAVGSLRPEAEWPIGTTVVLVTDHNGLFAGEVPLPPGEFLGCSRVYDPELIRLCQAIMPTLKTGGYVMIRGPNLETGLEARFLAATGHDVVGMSGIKETLLVHSRRKRNLAISFPTDLAGTDILHGKVQEIVDAYAEALASMLLGAIPRM